MPSKMATSGPSPKRHKRSPTEGGKESNVGENLHSNFTFETLLHLLFGRKENKMIDLVKLQKKRQAEKSKIYCQVCRVDRPPNGCPFHEPSSSKTADQDDQSLSYAIKSFPQEVQLCTSSIPGAHFGVCAKRVIPEGTWIGPYEGKRVKPEDLFKHLDNSYIWEIYENGQASCYIDGSDESESSWMRFIRCARHKEEQNLYAFQYLGNVFYRSFKDIPQGTEMLVWYDDKYPQYMGIPTGLQEIEFVNALDMERSQSAELNRKSPGQQFQHSTGDEMKHSGKEKLEDKTRQLGHYNYPKASSVPVRPRSLSSTSNSSFSSKHSTISFRERIEEPTRSSSRGIMEPTLSINYVKPVVPTGASLSYTPSGAYRKDFDPASVPPVNISAGVPSQSVMGRVTATSHTGITGTQIPDQKAIDEAPVIIPAYGSGMVSGNETLSTNRNWVSPFERNIPLNTSQTHPLMRGQATPQLYPRHTNTKGTEGSTSPPVTINKTASNVSVPTVSSVGSEIITTSQAGGEDSRQRRTAPTNQTVSEEALRERGYPVNTGSSRRSRSKKRPHSNAPSMSDYVWGEGDDLYESFSEEECQMFGEVPAKAAESDSNSSTTSSQPKDADSTGSPIDEISMWRCRQCQKTFTQRVMLQVHVCPHEPFKPYRCGQCELSFDTAPELRSHVDTHASEKPFKCGFCSRSFAGATTLNNHIRTHMGKRPFQCECGKSFAQAGQLARHQRTPGECPHITVKSET